MTIAVTKKKQIKLRVREAKTDDLHKIFFGWKSSTAEALGMDLEAVTAALETRYREIFKEKFDQVDGTYKIWVAELDEELVAWQYLMPFENNPVARNFSAEISTYVNPEHQGKGIGTALVKYALKHAEHTLLQYVCGFVTKDNSAMLSVADKLGFRTIGKFPAPIKSPEADESFFLVYLVPPITD